MYFDITKQVWEERYILLLWNISTGRGMLNGGVQSSVCKWHTAHWWMYMDPSVVAFRVRAQVQKEKGNFSFSHFLSFPRLYSFSLHLHTKVLTFSLSFKWPHRHNHNIEYYAYYRANVFNLNCLNMKFSQLRQLFNAYLHSFANSSILFLTMIILPR